MLKPEITYHQSDLEKKSSRTLKDPKKVQMNGKVAIMSQVIINMVFMINSFLDLMFVKVVMFFSYLISPNSRQVLISTGVKSIATMMIVNIDVAAAEPKFITSILRRSL